MRPPDKIDRPRIERYLLARKRAVEIGLADRLPLGPPVEAFLDAINSLRTRDRPVTGRIRIAALVAIGAFPAPASGATPVTVGPGSVPRVSVDAVGAGYVTAIEDVGNTSTFRYCKLPPGARACTAPFAYADAEQDVDGGYALLTPDGRVLLIEARGVSPTRAKLLWTSVDGGATFAGPTRIGTLTSTGGNIAGRALFAPAGTLGLPAESIMTIGELSGVTAPFQATGTAAGDTNTSAELSPNVSADIALQDGGLLATLADFSQLQWSRYTGPVPATVDTLNDAANWAPPQVIGPLSAANTETSLVSGPGGAFVGYEVDSSTPGQADFVVRRFTGAGWGAPAVVAADASKPDLHEDPSGRLHALWVDASGLRYRYTTDAANNVWSDPQTVVTGEPTFGFPRLAVNADGNGWAVWAGSPDVRAVPLTRATAPTVYSGPTRPVTTTGYGATYILGVPKNCLRPGQRFRVTLTWKRQKRKGNLFVKVRRSDFYLGRRVVKVDSKAPFVHTYAVTVTQAPGSTITLRARAFIKVKRGKSPKKSIRAKVRVCA